MMEALCTAIWGSAGLHKGSGVVLCRDGTGMIRVKCAEGSITWCRVVSKQLLMLEGDTESSLYLYLY